MRETDKPKDKVDNQHIFLYRRLVAVFRRLRLRSRTIILDLEITKLSTSRCLFLLSIYLYFKGKRSWVKSKDFTQLRLLLGTYVTAPPFLSQLLQWFFRCILHPGQTKRPLTKVCPNHRAKVGKFKSNLRIGNL